MKKKLYLMGAVCTFGLLLTGTQTYAGHGATGPTSVALYDSAGNMITAGSVPYSPKMTCSSENPALSTCHNYESDFDLAHKEHSGQTYDVPYPTHGVTAGYHFQQGRNMSWTDDQRHAYHLPEFTSGGGMWGKY